MTTFTWRDLRGVESARVYQAAMEAHAAARIAGSFGKALGEPKDDWAHVSLSWVEDDAAFWGAPAVSGGLRAGLRLAPLTLQLGDPSGGSEALDLAGQCPEDACAWVKSVVAERIGSEAASRLEVPALEPAHPADSFARSPDDQALAALEAWFSNANALLQAFTADIPQASPVRCWPHHFDVSTVIVLDADADPEVARSVSVGFSPGDAGHPEPYAYMLPWPRPGTEVTPRPFGSLGEWVSEEWFGARVSRAALMTAGDVEAQRAAAIDFVREAALEGYRLLGAEPGGDVLPIRHYAQEKTET